MLKVNINNLKVFGYHGCYDIEKKYGQFFIINIDYFLINSNKNSDSLENTTDYTEIIDFIEELFNHKRYNLLEHLVIYITDNLLDKFQIHSLSISIEKSNKYIMKNIDGVKVSYKKNNE